MSNFNPVFGAADIIYEKHLKVIKDITFTVREIEIISSILHNRGEKKIASLLLISPRTISSHVYNIMNKIGCNNKDQIIDFIEVSGMMKIIKEYYIHLLIKSHFEKLLLKIGSSLNRKTIKCFCDLDNVAEIDKKLYQSIERHLKLLNIEIFNDKTSEESYDDIFVINKISKNTYYEDMILSISNIIKLDELNKLVAEFNNIYHQIITGQSDHVLVIEQKNKYNNFIKIVLPIMFVIIIIFLASYYKSYLDKDSGNSIDPMNDKPEIIGQLETFLEFIKNEGFNANNVDNSQSKNNQSIIKKVEHILDYKNTVEVDKYFARTDMDSKFLLDYVYNLHSLASYYMYNMHDGRKSRDILLYCQRLTWHYLDTRSAVRIDFNNMTIDEIYSELDVIKDLPPIYARIIYSIGRTYIYQDGYENSEKYFEMSKCLGCKLGLFECYLSEVSGLLIAKKMYVEDAIKNNDKSEETKNIIKDIIRRYSIAIEDDTNYIADFMPNNEDQKIVVPAKNFYNIFTNQTRIIESYRDLLLVSDDKKELAEIISNISSILYNGFITKAQSSKENSAKGIKYIVDKIQSRRLAGLYNVLADIFLILYQKQENSLMISIPLFDAKMIEALPQKYSYNTNLEIAYQLFDKARSISRNTDFTKADSYEGIIKVYQEKLNNKNITAEEEKDFKGKIEDLEEKKRKINLDLGRT